MTIGQDAQDVDTRVVISEWIQQQTLKRVPTPGYEPHEHAQALSIIGRKLLDDESIAGGKLNATLRLLIADPSISRSGLTDEVFNGNSGYTMQIVWPLVSLFAGQMPTRTSTSTAASYSGWLNSIRKVSLRGLNEQQGEVVSLVIEQVIDIYASSVGVAGTLEAVVARDAEFASSKVDTDEPGIYVFTTLTYLANPPFGWKPDDRARQDFRYLKTGSTTVDVSGRIQTEIRRQTGLPEPYVILAKFQGQEAQCDYAAKEKLIHRLLGEARHGPEEDGTRRASSRGAGTEWFITRLPFLMAVAESVGLVLIVTDEFKETVNNTLEECELPDWMLT